MTARAGGARAAAARRSPPSPTAKVDRSRSGKLRQARAAGRRGEPAPAWVDDAELLAAYDSGASELGDAWAGDVEPASPPVASNDDLPSLDKSPNQASPPLPMPGPLLGSRTISPDAVRATGPAGDAAGAFLGLIAAAFVVNVIRGTWTQWLRAKFLNQVAGAPRADPNAAPGLPTPTSFGETGGVPQGVPFGGAQAAQSQANAAIPPVPFGGATAVGSQAGSA